MLMDWRFTVEAGAKETEDGIPTGLTIHNAQTELKLKCKRVQVGDLYLALKTITKYRSYIVRDRREDEIWKKLKKIHTPPYSNCQH